MDKKTAMCDSPTTIDYGERKSIDATKMIEKTLFVTDMSKIIDRTRLTNTT